MNRILAILIVAVICSFTNAQWKQTYGPGGGDVFFLGIND
jgi:hypothetical protein